MVSPSFLILEYPQAFRIHVKLSKKEVNIAFNNLFKFSELIKLGLNLWILLHFHLPVQGRAVQTALSLEEGLKQVVHLRYIDQVSPEHHDKLVHLTGRLQTDKVTIIAVNKIVLCLDPDQQKQ